MVNGFAHSYVRRTKAEFQCSSTKPLEPSAVRQRYQVGFASINGPNNCQSTTGSTSESYSR